MHAWVSSGSSWRPTCRRVHHRIILVRLSSFTRQGAHQLLPPSCLSRELRHFFRMHKNEDPPDLLGKCHPVPSAFYFQRKDANFNSHVLGYEETSASSADSVPVNLPFALKGLMAMVVSYNVHRFYKYMSFTCTYGSLKSPIGGPLVI